MKPLKIFSLALCVLFVNHSNAQINSTILDHNNVSAYISDVGTYFLDYTNQNLGYEVPKGSGINAIYSTQFWFAAKDALGEIHFVQGGVPNQGSDVFNGPISDPGTYTTPEYQNKWGNSIWSICQSDIDQFKKQFLCDQDPNCEDLFTLSHEALQTIFNWPAHGDVSSGQSFYLAPFFDYNGDGFYDPSNGDYPIIKGCCATYLIQNDAAATHSYTHTNPIGIEQHIMFYQYQTWDYLNNVTFVDMTTINRSTTNYPEFIHSIVVDANIGNPIDDYFGCDSLNDLTYYYNADNNDEDGLQLLGYGVNPPAIGIVSLKNKMTSIVPFIDGVLDVSDKWNLMKGFKSNGDPWLNPNLIQTKYVFSGNPNIQSEWSALTAGHPTGEAKSISSFDYGSFNSGDTIKQSYAITYARDGDNLANVQSIIEMTSDVKSFFDNESDLPCKDGTWNLKQQDNFKVTIYPNPSSGIVNISNLDKTPISLIIYSLQGEVIEEIPYSIESSFDIDLSKHSCGVYFFHIKTSVANTVRKVIIN